MVYTGASQTTVRAYKVLLNLAGIEPVTTRVADLATDADIALWIHPLQLLCSEKFTRGQSRTICMCGRHRVFRPLTVGLH